MHIIEQIKKQESDINKQSYNIYAIREEIVTLLNKKLVDALKLCIKCILSFDHDSNVAKVANQYLEDNNQIMNKLN